MKKRVTLLLPLFALLVSSCTKTPAKLEYDTFDYSGQNVVVDNDGYTLIDFYTLNDFHGALNYEVDATLPGISKMNTFLKEKEMQTQAEQSSLLMATCGKEVRTQI